MDIFTDTRDFNQAILSMKFYQIEKPPIKLSRFKSLSATDQTIFLTKVSNFHNTLVDILCYVFMPNHFHFLLKQNIENGVSRFISNFTNSYTRYFNTAHKRSGHLFQGQFKAVEIESEAQLIHVSRYIHLNPLTAGFTTQKTLSEYKWSSYPDYLKPNSKMITKIFKSPDAYEKFVLNHADYARELEFIKHQVIDIDP